MPTAHTFVLRLRRSNGLGDRTLVAEEGVVIESRILWQLGRAVPWLLAISLSLTPGVAAGDSPVIPRKPGPRSSREAM